MPATLSTARRTLRRASISLAYGPSDTPVLRMDVTAHEHQVRVGAGGEQVGHRQRVGHHLQRPADQQPGQLVGRAAAVEQDRVVVLDQLGRRARDRRFLSHCAGCRSSKCGSLGEGPV